MTSLKILQQIMAYIALVLCVIYGFQIHWDIKTHQPWDGDTGFAGIAFLVISLFLMVMITCLERRRR